MPVTLPWPPAGYVPSVYRVRGRQREPCSICASNIGCQGELGRNDGSVRRPSPTPPIRVQVGLSSGAAVTDDSFLRP